MWVFKNDAFMSLVQDRDMPDVLWARARVKGHLEAFFSEHPTEIEVIETPAADYRFRCAVSRMQVKEALYFAVEGIDYDNFKSSVAKGAKGNRFHDALLDVWRAMHRLQQREAALLAGKKLRWAKKKKKGPKTEALDPSDVPDGYLVASY